MEAICEIADSTKKVEDSRKGYIGEKGIDFKSVFKVADVVWISSGNFTFKFERDGLLGMIVPIWEDFPSSALVSAQSTFCLRIPNSKDRLTVKSHLLELRSDLLLFLRKLIRINIKICGNEGQEASHASFLRCDHETCDCGKISKSTSLELAPVIRKTEHRFFTIKFPCNNMPVEEKREGIRATEVVLGFPTSSSGLRNRWTYSFLPIRSYGLSVCKSPIHSA